MKYRSFANTDIQLSSIGLGCMGMNHGYGVPDDGESFATLEKSIELGINFWDTADIYANGQNEILVSKILKPNRDKIFLATKFGFKPFVAGSFSGVDCTPAYMRLAVEASLKRLQTDVIDLYYAHRLDPHVPVEEMFGAMAELVHQGKVRYLGLSEVSANTIRKAYSIHPVSAVQSEYSIMTREVESEIIPLCKELKIAFVPFSPLGRGLLTDTVNLNEIQDSDFRKKLPRYQESVYIENNSKLAHGFAAIANAKGCTPAQLALAWVLSQGDHIIPIPGTKKRKYLIENAAAVDIRINEDDRLEIENLIKAFPNTGPRYNEDNMKYVDR